MIAGIKTLDGLEKKRTSPRKGNKTKRSQKKR